MQTVFVMALWLHLILAGVQLVMYGWAYLAARHAANAAVQAARLDGATAADGIAAGTEVLTQAAAGELHNTSVSVQRGPQTVTAVVAGTPIRVVPFLPLPAVHVDANAPVEQFRSDIP